MKKLFMALALLVSGAAIAANNPVDALVEQNFWKTFPGADQVRWYEDDGVYEVHFTNDHVTCRLWYDKKGNILKVFRYYTAEALSPFIVANLQQKFPSARIFGITEVTTNNEISYYIVLQDSRKWYHVSSDAMGNLSVTKKYRKA